MLPGLANHAGKSGRRVKGRIKTIQQKEMKGKYLGELEELVLLTVGVLYEDAYGVAVMDEIEKQTGRSMNISAVHAVLTRLEEKGLIKSSFGDPTKARGGRRKRIYFLTASGKQALEKINELRNQMFSQITKFRFEAGMG